MAALTTLNITEKNANNSLSVTVKVNVTKEGVFTTTLSKEDVDKIHSYGIKLPTNRLGNEGYFNSIALSDLESQIREVLKRCLSYKIVEEVPVIKYQLETNCMFSYDKNGNIVPNPSKEWQEMDDKIIDKLLEIKTKIRQLGAMMNAYQCRFVVSSGQLFFVDDEYAGTVKLTNLDNGESNISFPSCDDGLIINPADKHIK